jgi:hypothetical protein
MFDDAGFDRDGFDTGTTNPVTVILNPPIWSSIQIDSNGWTLPVHGQGNPWAEVSDPETVWN